MAGVKGSGGPIPKRSDQRRRTNKPVRGEITKSPAGAAKAATKTAPKKSVTPRKAAAKAPPELDVHKPHHRWHPIAKRWFSSLAESGQSRFYEPSDWATAYLLAESIDRELKPQVIGATKEGEPILACMPPKGASLAAWLRGMTVLLVTEGDRRRMQLELQRPDPEGEKGGADVSELDEYRRRLRGQSG